MNYLCYDEITGRITESGWVDEDYLETFMGRNIPTLFPEQPVDHRVYKVDPISKAIVPLTEEELTPPQLPPPIVIPSPEQAS